MKKLNKCIHRSYSEEQCEKRWWKLIERFNLREDEWFLSLYNERKLWVPALLNDASFAGLYTVSRSESLNAFFDRYIHKETPLRDWVGQYNSILEDRYEEEAKANFDAWHETPDLMSPSHFEKQMLLIYTHEIFKKFQIEVLGAAACHLKKEDGSDVLYTVKDFQNNKEFKVKWDELKSHISCSCRLFEYEGYLCGHAIVVLQMSGVFSIPVKYVLKRWTNAATGRLPLSEKMDEVQSKIRRYNDLCRKAIILGEEGSLSEDSYNNAVGDIHQALRQCGKSNNPLENDTRPSTSTPFAILGAASVNHDGTITGRDQISKSKVITISKGSKEANSGKEPENNGVSTSKKGKVGAVRAQVSNVGTQGMFQQVNMSGNLDYPTLYPRFLTTLLKGGEMSKKSVELLGEMLEEQN